MFAILAAESTDLRILPHTDELILATIAFGILVAFLVKKVFPMVKKSLEDRTAKIQGQLEEAERAKREADQLLEQHRAQLAGARAEVQKVIDEGKRTAEALRADLVARAEQEAQEIVRRAQADVAGERDRAVQELKQTMGELSIELAARIIEQDLKNNDAARSLVDKAIQELASTSAKTPGAQTPGAQTPGGSGASQG
jgi:F-type H+-transporting ATPase subunit b